MRRHLIRCHDRMCGAEDCPNCHPENFAPGGCYHNVNLCRGMDAPEVDDGPTRQDAEREWAGSPEPPKKDI